MTLEPMTASSASVEVSGELQMGGIVVVDDAAEGARGLEEGDGSIPIVKAAMQALTSAVLK
jgi:hypothetical protein